MSPIASTSNKTKRSQPDSLHTSTSMYSEISGKYITVPRKRIFFSSVSVPKLSKNDIQQLQERIRSLSLSPSEIIHARITLIGNRVHRNGIRSTFNKAKRTLCNLQTLTAEEVLQYRQAINESGKEAKRIVSSSAPYTEEIKELRSKLTSGLIHINALQPVFQKLVSECGTESAKHYIRKLKQKLLTEAKTESEKAKINEKFIFINHPSKIMSDTEMKQESDKLKLRDILLSGDFTAKQCSEILCKLKDYNVPEKTLQRWRLKAKKAIKSKNLTKKDTTALLHTLYSTHTATRHTTILDDPNLVISKNNIYHIRSLIRHNLIPKDKIIPIRIAITDYGISQKLTIKWFETCKETINNSSMDNEIKKGLLAEITKSEHMVAHVKDKRRRKPAKKCISNTQPKPSETPIISQQTPSTISSAQSSDEQQPIRKKGKSKTKTKHPSSTTTPKHISTLQHIRTGLLNPDMLVEATTFLLENTPKEEIIVALKSYKDSHPHSETIVDSEMAKAIELLTESAEESVSTWKDPLPLTSIPTFEWSFYD